MGIWSKPRELEGRAEIYLSWKTLNTIIIVLLAPLIIAFFFDSIVVKIICWTISFSAYLSYFRMQGPCITAIAVTILPWYLFFELESLHEWLGIIAIIISIIEISYIRHRMRCIKEFREKENIPDL